MPHPSFKYNCVALFDFLLSATSTACSSAACFLSHDPKVRRPVEHEQAELEQLVTCNQIFLKNVKYVCCDKLGDCY